MTKVREDLVFDLDHIAIAAENLDDGVAWVEDRLGVAMSGGGKHPAMGTHNRLLSLGDLYLEVISIDPDAAPPPYPRWFDLDSFSGLPRLTNWILRCPDLQDGLAEMPAGTGVPMSLARGDLRWQMAVPGSGVLPLDGYAPALITWQGPAHPAPLLPESGVRLVNLTVSHPGIARLPEIGDNRLALVAGAPGLRARFATPRGEVTL